jgi:DNA-binding transcriptional LysR family regulator
VLAAESEELMGSLSRLGGVVEHLREGHTGSLAIGTFSSAAQMWMPHVAQGLQREFPDLVLELSLDELGDSAPAPPQSRDLDVTTEDADAAGADRPGYERLVLVEESYRVVIPLGHELLSLYPDAVPMAALADVPMIDADFSDTGCAVIVRNACRAAGFSPRYVARSDDHHTALAFVAARIGVTLLPELAVDEAMPGFASREVVSPAPRRRVVAFVRDSSALSPPVCRAVELLREAVAKTVERRAAR